MHACRLIRWGFPRNISLSCLLTSVVTSFAFVVLVSKYTALRFIMEYKDAERHVSVETPPQYNLASEDDAADLGKIHASESHTSRLTLQSQTRLQARAATELHDAGGFRYSF